MTGATELPEAIPVDPPGIVRLTDGLGAWLPIETAPCGSGKDGPGDTRHADYVPPPKLLLSTAEGMIVGYYDWYYHEGYGRGAEPGVSAWRGTDGAQTYGVTHWMPLPAPPQSA